MELVISNKSFFDMSEFDMFEIDGGAWGLKQWVAAGLITAGAVCGVVAIFCPPSALGTATLASKCWGAAGVILSGAGGIVAL